MARQEAWPSQGLWAQPVVVVDFFKAHNNLQMLAVTSKARARFQMPNHRNISFLLSDSWKRDSVIVKQFPKRNTPVPFRPWPGAGVMEVIGCVSVVLLSKDGEKSVCL